MFDELNALRDYLVHHGLEAVCVEAVSWRYPSGATETLVKVSTKANSQHDFVIHSFPTLAEAWNFAKTDVLADLRTGNCPNESMRQQLASAGF